MAQKKSRGNRTSGAKKSKGKSMQGVPRLALGNSMVYGFPEKLLTKLRYCATIGMTMTTGALSKEVMYINSTFDPDNTGTGHQPLYRDTFAAIYDQYAVVSTRAKVTIINTGTVPVLVGMVIDDDNSTSSTVETLMEQSTGQHCLLPAQAGSLSSHNFSLNWDCRKHLGIDPFASETYKTAVGSNPTEVSSLLIWQQPVDLISTVTNYITVELDMTVLWTELTTPTGS